MKNIGASATLAIAFFLAATTVANSFDRPAPKEGFNYPADFCTNRGTRVELGEQSCLVIGSRTVLAKCDMSVNSPTWRMTDEPCDPEAKIQETLRSEKSSDAIGKFD